MAEPLLVEIVAYAPTAYYHCTHCEVAWRATGVTNSLHDEQVRGSLPPDLASDYQAVSDWVHTLFREHGERVVVRVVDAASLEGFWKTLRYGIRRYPAVVVGRQARFMSGTAGALEQARHEIDRRLGPVAVPEGRWRDSNRGPLFVFAVACGRGSPCSDANGGQV